MTKRPPRIPRPLSAPFKKRSRKPPAPPELPGPRPLRAVLFCVDSANRSGIATWLAGQLSSYDELDALDPRARLQALGFAWQVAAAHNMPIGMVLEIPWRGGRRPYELALHGTAMLWRDSWLQCGGQLKQILEREAGDWRTQLFGSGARTLPRDNVRRLEAVTAARLAKPLVHAKIGPDAAAAICLGYASLRSGELRKALGCQLVEVPGVRGT